MENILKDFESNPEFQSVMEGMVNQMISKDVLYEPMKELREKVNLFSPSPHSFLSVLLLFTLLFPSFLVDFAYVTFR